MALRPCRECGKEISKRATACPSCGNPVKPHTSSAAWGCLILIVLGVIGLVMVPMTDRAPETPSKKKWNAAEIAGANDWWNSYVPQLEAAGMITDYKAQGSFQIIYVDGFLWRNTEYEHKKTLVRGFSISNEILGRTPFLKIKDNQSGRVYAEMGAFGIKVNE